MEQETNKRKNQASSSATVKKEKKDYFIWDNHELKTAITDDLSEYSKFLLMQQLLINLEKCEHKNHKVIQRQLRSNDEAVAFQTICSDCGLCLNQQ